MARVLASVSVVVAASLFLVRSASADITINIYKPCAADLIDDNTSICSPWSRLVEKVLDIEVNVASTNDVKSVHAQVGALGADLVATPASPGYWKGTLDMTSVAYGLRTLTVTATDV